MGTSRIGQLFTLAYTKPLSPAVLPNAKMYFYYTGTTTAQTVYADSGLTTPASNPVTADAYGRFTPIFLNPAVQYAWALYSAAGALLQSADPINSQNTSTPVQLFKAAATSRNLNAVLTADPDLSYAIVLPGFYKIELDLAFSAAIAGATPGVQLEVAYSGTLNPTVAGTLAITGALNGATLTAAQSAVAVNGSISGSLATQYSASVLRIAGTIGVSTAGTLALYWAQNVSSVNATSLSQGSAMAVNFIGSQ